MSSIYERIFSEMGRTPSLEWRTGVPEKQGYYLVTVALVSAVGSYAEARWVTTAYYSGADRIMENRWNGTKTILPEWDIDFYDPDTEYRLQSEFKYARVVAWMDATPYMGKLEAHAKVQRNVGRG